MILPPPADFFEEAANVEQLLRQSCQTQEQLSRALGVSQSYVANKIRLLRFSEDERALILDSGLTERHARALLRIPDDPPGERQTIIKAVAEKRLNVAQTEEYVEDLLRTRTRNAELQSRPPELRRKLVTRTLRDFCDAVDRAVESVRRSGIEVESTRTESEQQTMIRIVLPKAI